MELLACAASAPRFFSIRVVPCGMITHSPIRDGEKKKVLQPPAEKSMPKLLWALITLIDTAHTRVYGVCVLRLQWNCFFSVLEEFLPPNSCEHTNDSIQRHEKLEKHFTLHFDSSCLGYFSHAFDPNRDRGRFLEGSGADLIKKERLCRSWHDWTDWMGAYQLTSRWTQSGFLVWMLLCARNKSCGFRPQSGRLRHTYIQIWQIPRGTAWRRDISGANRY